MTPSSMPEVLLFAKGTKYMFRIDGKKHAKLGQTKDSKESEGHSINWLQ